MGDGVALRGGLEGLVGFRRVEEVVATEVEDGGGEGGGVVGLEVGGEEVGKVFGELGGDVFEVGSTDFFKFEVGGFVFLLHFVVDFVEVSDLVLGGTEDGFELENAVVVAVALFAGVVF